jgi:hypothetical protein
VVVRFVDIGAIVEYHCFNFLFIKANEFTDFYICNLFGIQRNDFLIVMEVIFNVYTLY